MVFVGYSKVGIFRKINKITSRDDVLKELDKDLNQILLRYKICIIRFITTTNISAKNYFFVYNEIQENVFCAGGVKTKTVEVGV